MPSIISTIRQEPRLKGCIRSPFSFASPYLVAFAFTLLIATVYGIYSLGFKGPFLFDDFVNLQVMGHQGQIDSWQKAWQFISSGFSGPTGRPIALSSFLLDDYSWPSQPELYKATNTCFHLLTGLLLFWLFLKLGEQLGWDSFRSHSVALLACAIWLLHPLHVSTVLYVVQRMTILASMFSVASLLTYILARGQWQLTKYAASLVLLVGSSLCFLLAVLSKENSAVLPMLVLLLEIFLLPVAAKSWQRLVYPILIGSTAIILGYLGYLFFTGLGAEWNHREFNMLERLMTQPRVLWMYLGHLMIPASSTAGLFNDGIQVSTGLLSPISTSISILSLGLLVGLALWLRPNYPLLTVAILFFLTAHLIESTVIPLELYFEHRNYFPTIFLAFAASYYLLNVGKYRWLLAGGLVLGLGFQLSARASLWSDQNMMYMMWSHNAPQSERAKLNVARIWLNKGDYYQAKQLADEVIDLYPQRPNAYLFSIMLDCVSSLEKDPKPKDFYQQASSVIAHSRWDPSTVQYLELLQSVKRTSQCSILSWAMIEALIQSMQQNPGSNQPTYQARMLHMMARNALYSGDPEASFRYYSQAYNLFSKPDSGMLYVSELATFGLIEQAKTLLIQIEKDFKQSTGSYTGTISQSDVNYMKQQLERH